MLAVTEPNWNIIVPSIIGVCVGSLAIFGMWDRVKKCFASKAALDLQKIESKADHAVLRIEFLAHVKRFEAYENHTAIVIEAQHAKTERLTLELLSEIRDRRRRG